MPGAAWRRKHLAGIQDALRVHGALDGAHQLDLRFAAREMQKTHATGGWRAQANGDFRGAAQRRQAGQRRPWRAERSPIFFD